MNEADVACMPVVSRPSGKIKIIIRTSTSLHLH
jgi:hypothetical protein